MSCMANNDNCRVTWIVLSISLIFLSWMFYLINLLVMRHRTFLHGVLCNWKAIMYIIQTWFEILHIFLYSMHISQDGRETSKSCSTPFLILLFHKSYWNGVHFSHKISSFSKRFTKLNSIIVTSVLDSSFLNVKLLLLSAELRRLYPTPTVGHTVWRGDNIWLVWCIPKYL